MFLLILLLLIFLIKQLHVLKIITAALVAAVLNQKRVRRANILELTIADKIKILLTFVFTLFMLTKCMSYNILINAFKYMKKTTLYGIDVTALPRRFQMIMVLNVLKNEKGFEPKISNINISIVKIHIINTTMYILIFNCKNIQINNNKIT